MSISQDLLKRGWVEATLGEVAANIAYGYTESATQEKVGPKFLRITDIQNDFIDWESVPFCPISEKDHKKYKLEIGDIVIARTGNSTGATATIKQNIDAVFASYLIRFRLDPQKADFLFVDFLLRSELWKGFVKSVKGGSAQGGANARNFAEFPISLPPLPEQRAIAAVLSSLDDKIELLREQNKTLEETAQAIFREWFGKYGVEDELPEGWRVGRLIDLSDHIKESVSPSISNELFSHYSIPSFDQGQKVEVARGAEILSNKYKVQDYSFLVSKLNPQTPRVWMIFDSEKNAVCSTEFQVIRPKNTNSFSFVYSVLNSDEFVRVLASKAHGTSSSHQRVRPQDILEVELVIPNDLFLNEYHALIYPFLKKFDVNKALIQTFTTLRDTLIPRLMKGEVRIQTLN